MTVRKKLALGLFFLASLAMCLGGTMLLIIFEPVFSPNPIEPQIIVQESDDTIETEEDSIADTTPPVFDCIFTNEESGQSYFTYFTFDLPSEAEITHASYPDSPCDIKISYKDGYINLDFDPEQEKYKYLEISDNFVTIDGEFTREPIDFSTAEEKEFYYADAVVLRCESTELDPDPDIPIGPCVDTVVSHETGGVQIEAVINPNLSQSAQEEVLASFDSLLETLVIGSYETKDFILGLEGKLTDVALEPEVCNFSEMEEEECVLKDVVSGTVLEVFEPVSEEIYEEEVYLGTRDLDFQNIVHSMSSQGRSYLTLFSYDLNEHMLTVEESALFDIDFVQQRCGNEFSSYNCKRLLERERFLLVSDDPLRGNYDVAIGYLELLINS